MTLKELMLGNIQSNQGAAVMQLGAQTIQKADNRNENKAFGEILGSKMNSTDRQSSVKRSDTVPASKRNSTDPLTSNEESKPKFLTFKEAKDFSTKQTSTDSSSVKTVKADDNMDDKTVGLEDESRKETVQDNMPNNMIQALAQVLGLDMRDLQKLLKEAGITSESFNNLNNIQENVSKLSQLLGLDNEQQETLSKLLEMTRNVIGSVKAVPEESGASTGKAQDAASRGKVEVDPGSIDKTAGMLAQKLDKTEQDSETDQQSPEFEALLAKLNGKIKIRLNEIGNELEQDQGSVEASLKQILQPLLNKTAGKMQESLQSVDGTGETGISAEPEVTTVAAVETASSKDGGEGQQAQAKSEKGAVVPQQAVILNETQPQTAFAVAQQDKAILTDTVEKAAITRSPVDTKEIISQVIEKAKVILTPDKSEMVMDLKPDSLGKISLKVATENGMVMAKFVAENQQVRQVLEANMQLLKDSLEKQGLNVQGFSVSVRQDSNRSAADNWKQSDGSKGYNTKGTEYPITGINGSLTGTIDTMGRSNPYTWGSSTINLTA